MGPWNFWVASPKAIILLTCSPNELAQMFEIPLSVDGKDKDGLLRTMKEFQKYSVNTWHQRFLDKLYA